MALRRIALRDFVIVQALDLDLHAGFTVLTGETGAGKSILIDALQLLLGARADTGVIREGAQRADICAEFDAGTAALGAWLEEAGIAHDGALLLRRTVDLQGKSRAWINGIPATAAQMRALGEHLLDIHGQHAWQSLTRPDAVRGLLDAYAGAQAEPLAALWTAWRDAQKALAHAREAQDTLQQERERLQWQIGEVDRLAPREGEWDELNAEHARLSNAQALLDNAQGALSALQDDEAGGALAALAQAQHLLQAYEHIHEDFRAMNEVLASCIAQADDVAHSLQGYLRHAEPDPDALERLDARLSQWMQLARRYKRTPSELPALLDGWKESLRRLDDAADLAALEAAEQAQAAAYHKAARALSQKRARAAPKLAQAITQAMQGLGMTGGRFEVQVDKATEPGPHGVDQVAFLVSSHPGMTPRPVGKVASGGELSRIALAISVATSALGEAPTLIFDEVDSGVGGAVAETVGRLMQQLGRERQVLAVTHLPQVAACANHHLIVSKHRHAEGTTSAVATAGADERVAEVARMLGGQQQSPTTLAHAREMLDGARAATAAG
ncbi:DNA repair protein RecN [Alicycliphilus denitrificans]|uniref:DNA repair protein RecN n=2 Tax=Alicycliphilus denitrificans TaxID=179636 RepID=F4G9E9_ALIDK|nr:DNA repair protein RecN [Alicycliphilus denitrificans]AEB83364.1 DNA repair protein RecN [Alicycliphilus denitrificans K601]QKD43135.1 DNA repair protein RecN [Alicycliphilus denitrificans]GAO26852.1 DNA repair protein RecN [Alicycliphilus sp. B1]